jgi:hypothetical protein
VRSTVLAVLAVLVWASPAGAAPSWLGFTPVGSGATDTPVVGLSADGTAHVGWPATIAGVPHIVAATRPPGGTFSAPLSISGATAAIGRPAIAVGRTGRVVVVWAQQIGGAWFVRANVRSPAGVWAGARSLSAGAAALPRLAVGIADNGEASVLWLQAPSTVQTRRLTPSGSWGTGAQDLPLTFPATPAAQPRIVVDRQGNATAVFLQQEPDTGGGATPVDVVAWAERTTGGTWTVPVALTAPADAGARAPQLAVGLNGHVAAVWRNVTEGRIEGRVRPARGLWNLTQPVGTTLIFNTSSLAVDGQGAATVTWSGDARPFDLWRRPAGGTWALESPPPPVLVQDLSAPSVAATPDGRLLLIWGSQTPGPVRHLQAATRSNAGWAQPQDLVTSNQVNGTALAADERGNGLAVWVESGGAVGGRAYDGAGPDLVGLTVPALATTGAAAAMSVVPRDRWSAVSGTTWSFGDGAGAGGPSVSHAYARPGVYTVTVTATDALGQETTARRTVTVAAPAVTLQRARLRGKFKRSRLRGNARLRLTGALTGGTARRLEVTLRGPLRPRGKVGSIATGSLTVQPGAFTRAIRIAKRGRLLPGRYRVRVTAAGATPGGARFRLAAPREGVVLAKKISTTRHGRNLHAISRATSLWATFRFAKGAAPRGKITVAWYLPGSRTPATTIPVGPSKPFTFWRDPRGLADGRWRVVLRTGRKIVDSVSIRIG